MSNKAVGLDAILEQLGAFGKYNIVNFALLLVPIFLAGLYGSVYVFEAPNINYRCRIDECEGLQNKAWINYSIPFANGTLEKCKRFSRSNSEPSNEDSCTEKAFNRIAVEECVAYVYDEEDSIVRDFDLGCQTFKRTLVGSIHNAGLFLSLPLTGFVSDRYGRRVALAVASLMNGVFGTVRSFSVNYPMLVLFEFLEAGLGAGAYSTSFVLAMELVGPKGRVFGNTLINAVYVSGQMSLAGLSWYIQDWRTVLRIIYTPAIAVICYLWILNESVRWLLSKNRTDEAVAILKKAARMNKVELSDEALIPLNQHANGEKEQIDGEKEIITAHKSSTFLEVMRSAIIRKRLFICSFLWITCTLVYYGLSINSVSLPGNMYVNFMVTGFVEIPANIVVLLVLDRFGRKKTLLTTYVLSGVLCIGFSFLPKGHPSWTLVLYLSGKFFITISYSSVYIYVSEVFPTSVRQSLLAVCSTIGRVGSTMAPLTPLLQEIYVSLPGILFGCMALMASLLVFSLPETINVPLPDTVEEAERLSREKDPV